MSQKFLKPTLAGLFFTAGAITLSACATKAVAPPGSALNAQDVDFVTAAYQLIHFDLSECQVVEEGNFSVEVKQVANQICSDANHYKPILEQTASTYNVQLPNTLQYDLGTEYSAFSNAGRATYQDEPLPSQADQDRTYIMDQIGSHETALGIFQDEANNGALPILKEFASQTVPVVEANLQRLRAAMMENNN